MRIPRWLNLSLLTMSLLAGLASSVWWWVAWPERTARDFAKVIVRQRTQQADSSEAGAGMGLPLKGCQFMELECGGRTLLDIVCGRQQFQLNGMLHLSTSGFPYDAMEAEEISRKNTVECGLRFTVVGGTVSGHRKNWRFGPIDSHLRSRRVRIAEL
jgi:hypothetical protein